MTTLDCSEIRDLLHAHVDGELVGDETAAVDAHLGRCKACAREHDDILAVRRSIAAAGTFPLPAAVEKRARAGLGLTLVEDSRWSRRDLALLAASHGLVAMLAAGVTATIWRRSDLREQVVTDAVTAHVRSGLGEQPVQVASSDRHTVRPWFTGRVDFAPPVPDLAGEGFPLTGGRLDYVTGRTAATLVYARRKHRVSVFILPERQAAAVSGFASTRDGFNVVAWQAQGFHYVAVSDLNRIELEQLRDLVLAAG